MRPIHYSPCVITCLICISGCISATTPYPADWSRTVPNTTSECPNLSGSYLNCGFEQKVGSYRVQSILGPFFFPESLYGHVSLCECEVVSHITFDDRGDDGVVVKAWVGDAIFVERQLSASQLPCREGHYVIHDNSWEVDMRLIPAVAHVSKDYLISLATDGSMVIEKKESVQGLAAISIPFRQKEQTWYRFPRTSSDVVR
jgi:hypothetical protein